MPEFAIIFLLTVSTSLGQAQERKVAELNAVRLHQPDHELRQRVDATPLASYIVLLENETVSFLGESWTAERQRLAYRGGRDTRKKVKIWCDAVHGNTTDLIARFRKEA
jgi:hypothetical protein